MDKPADRSNGYGRPLDRLPWLLRWVVLASACLLIVTAGAYVLAQIAIRLAPLSIALAATLFLAALLDPVSSRLRRHRVPPALAALAALLLLLGLLGGAVVLIWRLTADQFSDLASSWTRDWTGPGTSSPRRCRSAASNWTSGPNASEAGCRSPLPIRSAARPPSPRRPADSCSSWCCCSSC